VGAVLWAVWCLTLRWARPESGPNETVFSFNMLTINSDMHTLMLNFRKTQ
jgi:hypothetical protein